MKNIHLFETKEAYDVAKSGLILPTVSYIEETKVVDYNPHHDFVEIAGIKWATMNVGAKSITDYGCLYFQWGDTHGYTADQVGTGEDKKKFASDWTDCKWYDTSKKEFTKYNSKDSLTVLAPEDDAVHATWGGSWRMPTKDEFKALGDAVTTGWTRSYNNSGVAGIVCTAKNDGSKTLFFSACGIAYNGSMNYIDSVCIYWSNSIDSSYIYNAFSLFFMDGDNNVDWQYNGLDNSRYNGQCVRGVLDEK